MLHQGSDPVGEVFFAMCKSLDTPRSLACWLMYKYDHSALASLQIDPSDYMSPQLFKKDYLCTKALSKYRGLKTGVDLSAVALTAFKDGEARCAQTNMRLRSDRQNGVSFAAPSVLHRAVRKISAVLGPFSKRCVQDLDWGPGATASLVRSRSQLDKKITENPMSVTSRALPHFVDVLSTDLHWSACRLGLDPSDVVGQYCPLPHQFRIEDAARVCTVPKSAKTDRTIAAEPTANLFLQKGVGSWIRRRLKSVGIDLDSQEANQEAARAAYSEKLATVDLAAASDTLSLELVYELLPVDWAIYLDDLRSPVYELPTGERIRTQKFSTMGNGFTFELESLIFWALAQSACEESGMPGKVLVFGDDIIVPQEAYPLLVEVLTACGFSVNTEKSYAEGAFFESCGKHYFEGEDVTPFYQKEVVDSVEESIRLANRIIRCARRFGGGDTLFKALAAPWRRATNGLLSLGFQIPLGTEGDDGVLTPANYFCRVHQDANLGLHCKVLRRDSPRRLPADEPALLSYALRRPGAGPFEGFVSLGVTKCVPTHRWVMPTWVFGLDW